MERAGRIGIADSSRIRPTVRQVLSDGVNFFMVNICQLPGNSPANRGQEDGNNLRDAAKTLEDKETQVSGGG